MPTTYKLTVHEALAELKTLGARIDKEIRQTTFVTTNKHINTKIDGKPVKDYEKEMTAALQKIQDLITRRDAIKRAVTNSNAVTKVTFTDVKGNATEMTVAEAIEYKTQGIQYKENLLSAISEQYNAAIKNIRRNEISIEDKATDFVAQTYGNKTEISTDAIENARQTFIDANKLDLIDPNNVENLIQSLSDELDAFRTRVDAALSVSNAITTIEITY